VSSHRKILTVAIQLASKDVEHTSFQSKTSLLDWDIVLFRPDLDGMWYTRDEYQGKPCLTDSESFNLKESCEHWRREIKGAFEAGKTVLVFLAPLREVYVDTGQKTFSGTGRNARATRHVEPYSNYQSIPVTLGPIQSSGSAIKLAVRGAEILGTYWQDFGELSRYEVILTHDKVTPCLVTKTGDKPVGAIYRNQSSGGTLLLLPDMEFCPDGFLENAEDGGKTEDLEDFDDDVDVDWAPAAQQFAARLIGAIAALDRVCRASAEATPEPTWAADLKYALHAESRLRAELLEAESEVEQAQKRKERLVETLKSAGSYRALLFEKGKPLETAIVEALRLMGFSAAPYRDAESEFDVVFESQEGRLIGESEGKDNKSVNIDKLRQLAMNIHEDLKREEVTAPAKGVLFGNGYRLQAPTDRPDPFTDKCQSAAGSTNVALVFTPDLFPRIQYLLATDDNDYSTKCRLALINSVGRVQFPAVPALDAPAVAEISEE
jgi:hypothetical protein